MELLFVPILAMVARILLLGTERIFLKKLGHHHSLVVTSLFFIAGAISLIPAYFFFSIPLSFDLIIDARLAVISSLIYSVGFFLYTRALAIEDASLIAPLYNSSILWLMVLGLVVLDEDVSALRGFGAIVIFLGVFILYPGTIRDRINAIRSSKGSIYMLAGSVFIALGRTIDTFTIRTVDTRVYAFLLYMYIGIFLLIVSLLTKRARVVKQIITEDRKYLLLAGLVNGWSYLFLLIAIMGIGVTVAEPLSLLSLFVTAVLSKYVFDEKIEQRVPGTIVIIIGATLLLI